MGTAYYPFFSIKKAFIISNIYTWTLTKYRLLQDIYLLFDIFYVYEFLFIFMHVHHMHAGLTQVRKGNI